MQEQAALQTFPADVALPNNSRLAVAAIGNAVPPAFARVVARVAADELAAAAAEGAAPAGPAGPAPAAASAGETRLHRAVGRLAKRLKRVEDALQRHGGGPDRE